jgi:uncharacterized protein YaaR (DUF327 family)
LRIENNLKPRLETVKKGSRGAQRSYSFAELVTQSKTKLQQDALHQLYQDIEEQGEQLAHRMTVENLREYKKLVKRFLQEAVQYGLELKNTNGFNRRGRPRHYKIVEEIDRKLVELTNQILQEEKNQLEILSLVGDIKGMLVNLYS